MLQLHANDDSISVGVGETRDSLVVTSFATEGVVNDPQFRTLVGNAVRRMVLEELREPPPEPHEAG